MNSRDPDSHSRKACCCGGHSANDHKKSLQHNGTRRRWWYRQGRLLASRERYAATRNEPRSRPTAQNVEESGP